MQARGTLRKDFRVLAFWLGSVTTGADGMASVDVKLPESLTTYRIMAVAADRGSRFGSGDSGSPHQQAGHPEADVPALPGRRRHGLLRRRRRQPARVERDRHGHDAVARPRVLEFDRRRRAACARWRPAVTSKSASSAGQGHRPRAHPDDGADWRRDRRVRGRDSGRGARLTGNRRGVRRSGRTRTARRRRRCHPAGVVAGFGGLHVELSSTAMVGLGEGARYLVEYPYGCAEQQASHVAGAAAGGRSRRRVLAAGHGRRRACGRWRRAR